MDNILDVNNSRYLANLLSGEFKKQRLKQNITQSELAEKAGVSLGSLKRFENKSEISLKHLLQLAVALDMAEFFHAIHDYSENMSIDDVIKLKQNKTRKRARKK